MKTNLSGLHSLTFEDYRTLSAINKSGLDHIAKSPAHFQAYLKEPPEASDAMVLGQATHLAVFQPELLYQQFFARPEGIDGRTKEGKEKLKELGIENAGKTMLRLDDFQAIEGMVETIKKHPVSQMLAGGTMEASAIAMDVEHGVLGKARPDCLTTGDIIFDLKTTDSATFRAFQASLMRYRYHVQAAWYLDIVNAAIGRGQCYKRFIYIVIEKTAPYGLILYELDAEGIRMGRLEARANLKTYAECVRSGQWPGYPQHIMTMTVPVYE